MAGRMVGEGTGRWACGRRVVGVFTRTGSRRPLFDDAACFGVLFRRETPSAYAIRSTLQYQFASRLKLGRSCRFRPLKRLMTVLEPPEPPRADRKAFTYRRKGSKFDGRFSACEENTTAFLPPQGIRVFDEIQALRVYPMSCNHPDGRASRRKRDISSPPA